MDGRRRGRGVAVGGYGRLQVELREPRVYPGQGMEARLTGQWGQEPAAGVPVPGAGWPDRASCVVPLPPRILNMTTPQSGHLPFTALRPSFMISSTASEIGFLALHLTQ